MMMMVMVVLVVVVVITVMVVLVVMVVIMEVVTIMVMAMVMMVREVWRLMTATVSRAFLICQPLNTSYLILSFLLTSAQYFMRASLTVMHVQGVPGPSTSFMHISGASLAYSQLSASL